MNQVTNIKSIGGQPSQRKPAQKDTKVRKPQPDRSRQSLESDNPKLTEGRVGLMLDVNA